MKKWVGVLMVAMLAAQFTGSVSLRWRREAQKEQKDTGVFTIFGAVFGMVKAVPVIGGFASWFANWISQTIYDMEELSNGAMARLVGGAMPCEMSLKNGIQCMGITKNNNLATHINKVIDQTPLPGFIKTIIKNLVKALFDPAINVLFGGVLTGKN